MVSALLKTNTLFRDTLLQRLWTEPQPCELYLWPSGVGRCTPHSASPENRKTRDANQRKRGLFKRYLFRIELGCCTGESRDYVMPVYTLIELLAITIAILEEVQEIQ